MKRLLRKLERGVLRRKWVVWGAVLLGAAFLALLAQGMCSLSGSPYGENYDPTMGGSNYSERP